MNNLLVHFEKKINLNFKDKDLLENIFIHRSYLNEHKKFPLPSNEKLEFLGDSVLSLITSIYLYKKYPKLEEGDYTDIKASIVRTESLAEAAKNLGLGQYIYLSRGELKSGGKNNINILADCFEAVIAAIFLDFGFEAAYRFVCDRLFAIKLDRIVKEKLYLAPKSRFQELIQARFKITPTYKLIKSVGPEHHKTFTVQVNISGKKLTIGTGKSKKEAEEMAAKNALNKIDNLI